jgi:hypothetical protein
MFATQYEMFKHRIVKKMLRDLVTTGSCGGYYGPCSSRDAVLRECRTRYADESQNVGELLCDQCYEAYTEYWDGMWDEYYAGLGV